MLDTQQKHQNSSLLQKLRAGELLIIDPRQKSGLILYKHYYADFAGPGAIVGGNIDLNTVKVLTIGNISFSPPTDSQAKINAYLTRQEWIRIIEQITICDNPREKAQLILNQFQYWFDLETLATIPDEALALLVGLFPQTIRNMRQVNMGFN